MESSNISFTSVYASLVQWQLGMTVHMASCTSQTMSFLILILHYPAFAPLTFQSSPRRGPAYGQSCKPSSHSSAWLYMEMRRILDASTFGSLLGQYSPTLVCDMSRLHYNENLCERVGEQWFDYTFHSTIQSFWPIQTGRTMHVYQTLSRTKASDAAT